MIRAAIYARVSTTEQNPELQLDELERYATARSLDVVGEYVDHGVSGAKSSRPELDALMAAARLRQFDALLVWKLDRLARSVRHLTQLASELEALEVDLVVLDQSIDTGTPAGRLLFNVLGTIGEFEGDLIRERTRAGLVAARRRGKRLGRPTKLDRREQIRARRLAANGHSIRRIAETLGCSPNTAMRAIRGHR